MLVSSFFVCVCVPLFSFPCSVIHLSCCNTLARITAQPDQHGLSLSSARRTQPGTKVLTKTVESGLKSNQNDWQGVSHWATELLPHLMCFFIKAAKQTNCNMCLHAAASCKSSSEQQVFFSHIINGAAQWTGANTHFIVSVVSRLDSSKET